MIDVGDKLGVAKFYLERDSGSNFTQKLAWFICSDAILNLLFALFGKDLRNMYLNYVLDNLLMHMSPAYYWGDEKFAKGIAKDIAESISSKTVRK